MKHTIILGLAANALLALPLLAQGITPPPGAAQTSKLTRKPQLDLLKKLAAQHEAAVNAGSASPVIMPLPNGGKVK